LRILSKNEIDINNAKQLGLDFHIIDRLTLNKKRIQEMSDSILNLIQLPDPVGELIEQKKLKKLLLDLMIQFRKFLLMENF